MIRTVLARSIRRAEETSEKKPKPVFGIPHWIPYDLRTTAATGMTSLGVPRLVVGKILNHSEKEITRVYDRHSYDDEKREALKKWGQKVSTLIAEKKKD